MSPRDAADRSHGVPTPNAYERGAMWWFGEDYAQSGLSAVDYFKALHDDDKDTVMRMVDEIRAAPMPPVRRPVAKRRPRKTS